MILLWTLAAAQNSSCEMECSAVKANMKNFIQRYQVPQIDSLFVTLHDGLQSTTLATWLLCFNKTFIDPYGNFTKNNSLCLQSLDQAYNLSLAENNQPYSVIQSNLQKITNVVLPANLNCYAIMNYTYNKTVSDDCWNTVLDLQSLLEQYNNAVLVGKSGVEFLNDMLLKAEYMRRDCDFGSLPKPPKQRGDVCQQVNLKWLAPIADQFWTYVRKGAKVVVMQKFIFFYHSLIRAQQTCSSQSQ